jgi:hypothetical protein
LIPAGDGRSRNFEVCVDLFGAERQIQRKSQRVPELLHGVCGKASKPSFKADGW